MATAIESGTTRTKSCFGRGSDVGFPHPIPIPHEVRIPISASRRIVVPAFLKCSRMLLLLRDGTDSSPREDSVGLGSLNRWSCRCGVPRIRSGRRRKKRCCCTRKERRSRSANDLRTRARLDSQGTDIGRFTDVLLMHVETRSPGTTPRTFDIHRALTKEPFRRRPSFRVRNPKRDVPLSFQRASEFMLVRGFSRRMVLGRIGSLRARTRTSAVHCSKMDVYDAEEAVL